MESVRRPWILWNIVKASISLEGSYRSLDGILGDCCEMTWRSVETARYQQVIDKAPIRPGTQER